MSSIGYTHTHTSITIFHHSCSQKRTKYLLPAPAELVSGRAPSLPSPSPFVSPSPTSSPPMLIRRRRRQNVVTNNAQSFFSVIRKGPPFRPLRFSLLFPLGYSKVETMAPAGQTQTHNGVQVWYPNPAFNSSTWENHQT